MRSLRFASDADPHVIERRSEAGWLTVALFADSILAINYAREEMMDCDIVIIRLRDSTPISTPIVFGRASKEGDGDV